MALVGHRGESSSTGLDLGTPLNVGSPVDPEQVFGRERELRDVFAALPSVGILLTGERRMGKTSLAMRIAREAHDRGWDVVRQSCEGFATVDDLGVALVARLDETPGPMHQAAVAIRDRWALTASGIERAPAQGAEIGCPTAPWLLEDTVATAVRASSQRLLLILDDLPLLAHALDGRRPGDGTMLLHVLRRQRQEHPDRLRMLITGSFHHVVRDGEGVLNDLYHRRVGPLSRLDATYLAAAIFRHALAPESYERVLAPIIAELVEGVPFHVQQLVAAVLRHHPLDARAQDVERIIEEALVDPDDPWDLRGYVDQIAANYGDDAAHACGVLDVISDEPSGVRFSELTWRLAADARLAPLDDDRARDILSRLEADRYIVRDGHQRRFAFSLVRRAWIAHRSPRHLARLNGARDEHAVLGMMATAASAMLEGDSTALQALPADLQRIVEQMVLASGRS